MSVPSFKENSLGWQVELAQQKWQEWWELKISQLETNTPNIPLFDSAIIQLLIKIILWSLIAIILVWLTWQIWLFLRPMIKNWSRQRQQLRRTLTPNQLKTQLSPQDWLTRAQQYYQQQNYRQGIFCLYQGILQHLSDLAESEALRDREKRVNSLAESEALRGQASPGAERDRSAPAFADHEVALCDRKIISILSSRTDREYLKLIKKLKLEQFLSYKLLFLTHEQLCFSNLSPSASLFDKCQQAYQVITSKYN